MDRELVEQLKHAESDIAETERLHGPLHPDLADKLSKYAALLRQTDNHALDAVNVEARAKAIRARLYHDELLTQETKIHIIRPPEKQSNPAIYIGMAAMCFAFASLFVDQSFFFLLALLAAVATVVDLIISKGSAVVRTIVTVGLIGCSWWGIQSLPAIMLTDASPMERLNYASENPEIVQAVMQMGAPQSVLAYKLCLPSGVDQLVDDIEQKQEWGRVFTWKNNPQIEQIPRMFQVCSMKLPRQAGKASNAPVGKLTKDFVVQRIAEELGLIDLKEEPLIFEDINGFEFARAHFSGSIASSGERLYVFVYAAKDKNNLLVISGNDKGPGFDALEPLEASVYTIRKDGGKQVDI